MKQEKKFIIAWIACLVLATTASCGPESSVSEQQDNHADHGEEHDDGDDGHEEHDDDHSTGGDSHDDHEEEAAEVIELSEGQLTKYGVVLEPLGGGTIAGHLTLPAEVGLNQDSLAHITPRASGVVTEVRAFLGDDVTPDTLLAVLESPELGEAKITLLQAIQRQNLADADLELQRTISVNTELLLGVLRGEPSLELLRAESSALLIGENKGRLLSAYARLKASEANYARERELQDKGLSTQADLLAAQEGFNSGLAEYMSIFEEIDFTYRIRLQDAKRAAQIATSEVDNARRRLRLLGLGVNAIEDVSGEAPESIARYEITSPIGGRIVSKHVTPGESVENEETIYTIADLSTVWLNIAVYERYQDQIVNGQEVVVHAGERNAQGRVVYVSTTLTEGTRTLTARVVLDNTEQIWRPGEFITVQIGTTSTHVQRRVPVESIQKWEGNQVIFVRHEHTIEPVKIRVGLRSHQYVELLNEDIALGTQIVVKNSFLMKSELGKSSAGHEH